MRFPLILSSLFFCFISSAQSTYQALSLDETLTKNANAIVRLDEMVIDIASINEMSIQRKKVITVLNKLGNSYAAAYVGYDDATKVKDIYMIVYDKTGKEIEKFKKKDFNDASAVDGSTLYSDSKVKYHPYMAIEYPYTVELNYTITTANTGEIQSVWPFALDFQVSTEKSKLVINYAQVNLKPAIKEKNFENIMYSNNSTDSRISYEATNLAALKMEYNCPAFAQIAPHLLIRPINFHYEGYDAKINDWNDLGIWMYKNLLTGRDELSTKTIEIVKNLVKDATDDLEKAKIVYQYVQENTRYISVQVGIGGIQPISAIEVDRVKYGDCKGLSNYTMALLKSVGVTSYYVHVEAGNDKISFEDNFPNLAQGNHVILAIPYNDTYSWIDCTSQIAPFGFIGNFTDDRKVLVIKPDGGEIVSTTSYIDDQNYQKTEANYILNSDGSIEGSVVIESEGSQYDYKYNLEKESEDNIKSFYKNHWETINNLTIKSYGFKNNGDDIKFTESVAIKAKDYASKSGQRLLFSPNIFNRIKNVPPRYRDRKLPFEIQRGFFDEDEYVITLPEGYTLESMPDAVSVASKYGDYEIAIIENDGKIKLNRKLAIKKSINSKDDYEGYRNFLKKISKSDASKIVLKPSL